MPANDHRWHMTGDVLQTSPRGYRRDQHYPVHPAVNHRISYPRLCLLTIAPRSEQHLIVGRLEAFRDPIEDVREERVANIRQHYTDRVGLTAHSSSSGVWT